MITLWWCWVLYGWATKKLIALIKIQTNSLGISTRSVEKNPYKLSWFGSTPGHWARCWIDGQFIRHKRFFHWTIRARYLYTFLCTQLPGREAAANSIPGQSQPSWWQVQCHTLLVHTKGAWRKTVENRKSSICCCIFRGQRRTVLLSLQSNFYQHQKPVGRRHHRKCFENPTQSRPLEHGYPRSVQVLNMFSYHFTMFWYLNRLSIFEFGKSRKIWKSDCTSCTFFLYKPSLYNEIKTHISVDHSCIVHTSIFEWKFVADDEFTHL